MKILFVIKRWKGGVGRYVSELKNALEKKGHKVKVISREDDLKCYSFLKSFSILKRAVLKEKYDVLNTQDWSIALPLIGMKNHFCTFNGISTNFPANLLQKFVYWTLKEKTIVVSNKLKNKFPKSQIVYEGVDLNTFRPKKKKKYNKLIVGFAQNPNKFYNFDLIKDAVKTIPNSEFWVAWTKNKEVKDVKLLGYLDKKEMVDFYNKIDIFISLPKKSGFNLVWLEAMACNIPTVGNNAGIGNALPITKVGRLNVENIKKSILKEVKRKENYRKWLIENGFTWDNVASNIIKVYLKKGIN